jgi:hypothetical protein
MGWGCGSVDRCFPSAPRHRHTAVWYGHGKSCSVVRVFPRNRNGEIDWFGNCDSATNDKVNGGSYDWLLSFLCSVVSNFSYVAESDAIPYLIQPLSFIERAPEPCLHRHVGHSLVWRYGQGDELVTRCTERTFRSDFLVPEPSSSRGGPVLSRPRRAPPVETTALNTSS